MKEKPSSKPPFSRQGPWANNHNNIWLASTLRIHRNLAKHPFPPKLNVGMRQQVLEALKDSVLALPGLDKPELLLANQLTPLDREYLFEHYLGARSFQQVHGNEGFIVDRTGAFLALINIQDHLQIQLVDCEGELETSLNKLVKMETAIGSSLRYAFSSHFGFLTSDPMIAGTALSVSIYLHLPALIHLEQLMDVLEEQKEENVVAMGMQGGLTEVVGHVLTISNGYTLGVNEETIIGTLRTFATKLMVKEKSARGQLKKKEDGELRDHVSRSYGLLSYSYQLRTIETLNALSWLKLGVDLGWVSGLGLDTLNELFITTRRAHLSALLDKEVENEELPKRRAQIIHTALEGVAIQ